MLDESQAEEKQEEAGARRLALALSGGGHRACLFGLGAVLYLAEVGRCGALASVSSVSGGSLANGALAQSVDLTRADADEVSAVVARVAGQITSRGTLFGTITTFAYLAAFGLASVALLAAPWFLALPLAVKIGATAIGVLLVGVMAELRGWACGLAFDRTVFRPTGRSTRLDSIHAGLDHVFCATELHGGEHVYFSRDFVSSYRFGKGVPGDVKLSTVVRASAAFPGAFPPTWLRTSRHGFANGKQAEAAATRWMTLVDGGVYDNMGDQWALGMAKRIARDKEGAKVRLRDADELVVVNSSAGLDWGSLRFMRVPIIGELLALMRDKSVLYDNGNSLRRQALVTRFGQAEREGSGLRGALVHIPQSPFLVPSRFAPGKGPRAERAKRALAALRANDPAAESAWAEAARANSAVPTSLVKLEVGTAARLLHHAYVLAMVNLHVILGYPLLEIPDRERFEALARGEAG